MSLYREPGRRRNLAAVAIGAALVVGLAVGLPLGRATKGTPTLADQIADVQERTRPVVDGLDLVRLHVRSDRAAALAQAQRARASFDEVEPDLRALHPAATAAASQAVDETVRLTATGASAAAVDRAAVRAARAARTAARLR
jgi:hypothetical protein